MGRNGWIKNTKRKKRTERFHRKRLIRLYFALRLRKIVAVTRLSYRRVIEFIFLLFCDITLLGD